LQIVVPPLPGKALKRQLPFRGDDGKFSLSSSPLSLSLSLHSCCSLHVYTFIILSLGIFDDDFIEDRRKGLEEFVNK
jgi:sorting nexin-3/12